MATVRLWSDADAESDPRIRAVFGDIRATRGSDCASKVWRGLADDPATAAARTKGLTDAQNGEFLAVVGMADRTDAPVTGMPIAVVPVFRVDHA